MTSGSSGPQTSRASRSSPPAARLTTPRSLRTQAAAARPRTQPSPAAMMPADCNRGSASTWSRERATCSSSASLPARSPRRLGPSISPRPPPFAARPTATTISSWTSSISGTTRARSRPPSAMEACRVTSSPSLTQPRRSGSTRPCAASTWAIAGWASLKTWATPPMPSPQGAGSGWTGPR